MSVFFFCINLGIIADTAEKLYCLVVTFLCRMVDTNFKTKCSKCEMTKCSNTTEYFCLLREGIRKIKYFSVSLN